MMDWFKARASERSTWTGAALVVLAVVAPRFGFNYADAKDALLMLGAALAAHQERKP